MDIQTKDGILLRNIPDGTPEEEIKARISTIRQERGAQPSMPWSEVGKKAVLNLPKSVGGIVGGLYQAVRHPIDTGKTILDIAAGGLQNALPESVVSAVNEFDANPEAAEQARLKADAVGQFYGNRYGSMDGFKKSLAEDPAGIVADAASVLTLGGGAAAKIPGLSKVGQAATRVGRAIDPLALTVKGAKLAAKGIGNATANIIGGLGTHTGAESIKAAARAGLEGGERGRAFLENMRGKANIADTLDDAKTALDNMRKARSAEYKAGMAGIKSDKTVLDFKPIADAFDDIKKIGTYKGKALDRSTSGVRAKIAEIIDDWKASNPSEYHTPEGLDALKKAIGDIRDSTDFGTPSRKVADTMYHSVKQQITKQAPAYAAVMKEYEQASDLVRDIEKFLSQGKSGKINVDAAVRKLQSVTRNNANTNYGNRLRLVQEIEKSGAPNITAALSGQALTSWTPRGLGSATALGTGGLGYWLGGPMLAAPTLAAQSPRLMGEAAYKAGQIARIPAKLSKVADPLRAAGIDPTSLANYLYQSGRLYQETQ